MATKVNTTHTASDAFAGFDGFDDGASTPVTPIGEWERGYYAAYPNATVEEYINALLDAWDASADRGSLRDFMNTHYEG